MQVNRSAIASRFALPQTRTEWEQLAARIGVILSKVPLERWQFVARVLLVFCLTLSLARLFWLLVPNPLITPAVVALPSAVNSNMGGGEAINIAQLKSLPVFGKVEVAAKTEGAPAAPIIENQAIDTHLNLILLGIIGSNDDAAARAIISSGDKQDVYAIGSTLPVGNGVTLAKVMDNRVIINNNGQYESLWLYQNDPNAPAISQTVAAPVAPQYPANPRMQMSNNGGGQDMGPDSPAMAQATRTLSDVVSMSIYRENGQVIGYKIRPGRDGEKFKSLGLQMDDVVTAVNGMPLSDPSKIMEVYKNMGNTTSATLEIKRSGSVMQVDVVLQ
jgi:general secretion pathway protein C